MTEGRYDKGNFRINIIEVIIAFVVGMVTMHFAYQNYDNSKLNSPPFFDISANKGDGKVESYTITNTGGYIQSASITLKNYIEIQDRCYGVPVFYFPYDTLIEHYSDVKDDSMTLDFNYALEDDEIAFGIDNWSFTSKLIQKIEEAFENQEELINSGISYLEIVEILYMDCNKEIHDEKYLIQKDDKGDYQLVLITDENMKEINNHLYEEISGERIFSDELTSISEIGSTGSSGGGRGVSHDSLFVDNIVKVVQEYEQQYSNNEIDTDVKN